MDQHYKNFNMEPEEIDVDRKIIKVIDSLPENLKPRFKALYMNDNERAVIGDKMDCEIEALEKAIALRKVPHHEEQERIIKGERTIFDSEVEIFDKTYISLVN